MGRFNFKEAFRMLNPKFVRNNPELVKTKLQTRKVDPAEVDEYLQLDQ